MKEVDSTNSELYRLGMSNASEGTVVISDYQTDGKGRLNRKWHSPKGVNLYMSVLFRPNISPKYSSIFTFIASLALYNCFQQYDINNQIKWPNDIIIGNKKVAGVLTELKLKGQIVDFIIVGIGVNLNATVDHFRSYDDMVDKATSLFQVSRQKVDREIFISKLLFELEDQYFNFKYNGPDFIVASWVNEWGYLNKPIYVDINGEVINGIVKKIDKEGFLYLELPGGDLKKIVAGDIFQDTEN